MITFNRIDHIGMAVPEIEPQLELMEGLFGFRRQTRREDSTEGYTAVMLEMPGTDGIGWELLEPLGDDSSLSHFIDGPRGPGVHHVSIEVPDIEKLESDLRAAGLQPLAQGSGRDVAIHPERGGHGFLFRFFEPSAGPAGAPVESAAPNTSDAGIVRLDHLCHAYIDREDLRDWYHELFGMREIWRTPENEHPDMADLVLEIPGQETFWEIIQPVGEESFIERFLERRGPSIHHVTFQVSDWDRAVSACEQHQAPLFDENSGVTDDARWRDAFIHPRHTGGMLVQLFWEESPGVWIRSDKTRPPGWKQ